MVTILNDVKSMFGIGEEDQAFDTELTMHINSVITVLTQLGVGPLTGIIINAQSKWQDLIGSRKDLEIIKTYIYLKVRLIFDPPQNSFLVSSINDQCKEFEWRIEVQSSEEPQSPTDDIPENIDDPEDENFEE